MKNFNNRKKIDVYVDGSYDEKTQTWGSGVIIIENNKPIIKLSFCGNKFSQQRQVAGELKGVMEALNYIKHNIKGDKDKDINIYYDYKGIMAWATGIWSAKAEISVLYRNWISNWRNRNPNININWIHIKSHTGNLYNEQADKIAFEACHK